MLKTSILIDPDNCRCIFQKRRKYDQGKLKEVYIIAYNLIYAQRKEALNITASRDPTILGILYRLLKYDARFSYLYETRVRVEPKIRERD